MRRLINIFQLYNLGYFLEKRQLQFLPAVIGIIIRTLLTFGLFYMCCTGAYAQEKGYIKKGNDLYQQQKFRDAEVNYRKSVAKQSQNLEGNFNLGDALYKQKKFIDAGQQFTKIATTANNKAVSAQAYHNLGNSLVENKKLEEGIEAYKKALLNNPKDEETRYNLAYAQEKLKQQQQQDKKNQDNKKNQDKKDQDKKKQDDKDKQNQDKKDQNDKNNKDKQDRNKQNKDQDKKDQQDGQQPQPDKLSKEDAQRMLDALNNNEKQTQEKLKNKKFKGAKIPVTKDW